MRTRTRLYGWQGTRPPACQAQYVVDHATPGDGSWSDALTALLSGMTGGGLVSPFGPAVRFELERASHTVNILSTGPLDSVPVDCRNSVDQLIMQTGTAATPGLGSVTKIVLRGSSTAWQEWKNGRR